GPAAAADGRAQRAAGGGERRATRVADDQGLRPPLDGRAPSHAQALDRDISGSIGVEVRVACAAMATPLQSYLTGSWTSGAGKKAALVNPSTEGLLAETSTEGL